MEEVLEERPPAHFEPRGMWWSSEGVCWILNKNGHVKLDDLVAMKSQVAYLAAFHEWRLSGCGHGHDVDPYCQHDFEPIQYENPWYSCRKCGGSIEEQYLHLVANGWRAPRPEDFGIEASA